MKVKELLGRIAEEYQNKGVTVNPSDACIYIDAILNEQIIEEINRMSRETLQNLSDEGLVPKWNCPRREN